MVSACACGMGAGLIFVAYAPLWLTICTGAFILLIVSLAMLGPRLIEWYYRSKFQKQSEKE